MSNYTVLNEYNVAPSNASKIGVYNENGTRVGSISLPNNKKINTLSLGNKKYSFGAVSDIHLGSGTNSTYDFERALNWFDTKNVDFTCVCGDISGSGTTYQFDAFNPSSITSKPVYAITGNHDALLDGLEDKITQWTGESQPLYYHFEHNGDVFVMIGTRGVSPGTVLDNAELQWLYNVLEDNRNKRVFLFHHVRNTGENSSGNALNVYGGDIWGGNEGTVLTELLSHYKNVIWFHGHTHVKFYYQYASKTANVSNDLGMWSIHIPSLNIPRYLDEDGNTKIEDLGSEGYIVDVYDNGIVLNGRDFANEKMLPVATYQLLTTLSNITASTFTDSLGIVDTSNTKYSITNNLTNVTSDNNIVQIGKNLRYKATLSKGSNYSYNTVTVKMGGSDVTSTYYNNGVISIPSVTGNVDITAVAISQTATNYTVTNNLTHTSTNNSVTEVEENSSYTSTITASSGFNLSSVTVTMGGTDITSTSYTSGNISIASVTGNIVITAIATEQSTGGEFVYDNSNLIYSIESPMEFDGSTTSVNTEVTPFDNKSKDVTILIKFDSPSPTGAMNLINVNYTKPYHGWNFNVSSTTANWTIYNGNNQAVDTGIECTQTSPVRLVLTHTGDDNIFKYYVNSTASISNQYEDTSASSVTTEPIRLGVGYSASKQSWSKYYFKGTIYRFYVFERLLTDEEISSFMQS